MYSILNACATTSQLIPWGVVTLTETDQNTLVGQFSLPSWIGTMVLIVGYLIACFVAWPCDRRKSPRRSASLIDTWALCHYSYFSTQPELWAYASQSGHRRVLRRRSICAKTDTSWDFATVLMGTRVSASTSALMARLCHLLATSSR